MNWRRIIRNSFIIGCIAAFAVARAGYATTVTTVREDGTTLSCGARTQPDGNYIRLSTTAARIFVDCRLMFDGSFE